MKIEIIKKNELQTKKWSGGTTTQLAIFPKNSSYEDRTFTFRLSSAKVEVEKSTFTNLNGVSRTIMILDGKLKLNHQNKYTKILNKYEIDKFEGGWTTTSEGRVTDFNLMTTGKCSGELESKFIDKNKLQKITLAAEKDVITYYSCQGSYFIKLQQKEYLIEAGDFVMIFKENKQEEISIKTIEKCELVIAKIKL